ncbi:MAG: tRNA pseudouridine(55) synthase TruB, partial [Thermomicrobiales bacterium]
DLADQANHRPWTELAFHPDMVLHDLPAAVVGSERALEWRQGKLLKVSQSSGVVRVYDTLGRWLGVGSAVEDGQYVQPEKVIIPE